jgi:hypothetical protein
MSEPADLLPADVFSAGPCNGCEVLTRPASWCPAFGVWLCELCRTSRTDRELLATRQANEDACAAARAAAQAAGGPG